MSEVFRAFAYDWRVSVVITLCGLACFGALTIFSLARHNKPVYIPSLLLIDFGILNSLVRNLFFLDLSPHPMKPGGAWRLVSALLIAWGFVLFLAVWLRERSTERGPGAAG